MLYLFPMSFFLHQHNNNTNNNVSHKSAYFRDIVRTDHYKQNSRKCITRTKFFKFMSVHLLDSCSSGWYGDYPGIDAALIHHYFEHTCNKDESVGNNMCTKSPDRERTQLLQYEEKVALMSTAAKEEIGFP